MACPLCKIGNRENTGHINSFKHKKALIKLFKMYNEKKKDIHPKDWDDLYDYILFTMTGVVKN